MKKVFYCCLFVCFAMAANAGYVRKLKEPDFFIPETDKMHKPEKLPKVEKVFSVKRQNRKEIFTTTPEYKKKYSQYLAEMETFAKTNSLVDNPELDADLEAMSDGEVFEVTEVPNQVITAKEQKEFYYLAAKILND